MKIIAKKRIFIKKCHSLQENYQDRDELKRGAELKMMFEELCKQWIRYQKSFVKRISGFKRYKNFALKFCEIESFHFPSYLKFSGLVLLFI